MRRALCALAAGAAMPALAQDPPPNVLTRQNGGTFIAPPARVDPVYTPAGPDQPQRDEARQPFALQLALDVPLRSGGSARLGRGVQGSTAASPTLQAQLRWHPLPREYWFAQAIFYRYLHADRQQPWHPDFSYGFGYDDPRPGHWSLTYANYTGTRFHPAEGEGRFNFPEGEWKLAYRFALPQALEPWLLVGDGDDANCSANGHFVPRYSDFASGSRRSGKAFASLACRYRRASGWYADLALYAYAGSGQQPWDPDFTYGFGYDAGRPGTVTVRYNNYSGNRFPGRARGAGEGSFRSGSVTLAWEARW